MKLEKKITCLFFLASFFQNIFLLQVFNSIGIAFGCLVAFSSYNPFHGPILKDTLIVVVVDALTCIICGLCVFSTMGNLALEQGTVDNFLHFSNSQVLHFSHYFLVLYSSFMYFRVTSLEQLCLVEFSGK